jgi:hypothetical protein
MLNTRLSAERISKLPWWLTLIANPDRYYVIITLSTGAIGENRHCPLRHLTSVCI